MALDNKTKISTINKNECTTAASAASMDLNKTNPSSSTSNLALDNKTKNSTINKNESTTTASGSSIDVKKTNPSSSTNNLASSTLSTMNLGSSIDPKN